MSIDNIMRALDDRPPDWPVALVNLIDALRDYIRTEIETGKGLWDDGSITREEYESGVKSLKPLQSLLKELESHGIDPSLHGLLP